MMFEYEFCCKMYVAEYFVRLYTVLFSTMFLQHNFTHLLIVDLLDFLLVCS